jgi:hypothetical protein
MTEEERRKFDLQIMHANRNAILEEAAKALENDTFNWGGKVQRRVNADYFADLIRKMKREEG